MAVAPGGEPGLSLRMKTMTVSEAEAGFARLLGWVASGEEVEILDQQRAIAKVVPVRKRTEASLAGSVVAEDDLVSPTGVPWGAAS